MMTYEQAAKLLGNKMTKNLRYAEKLDRSWWTPYHEKAIAITRHGRPVIMIYSDGSYRLHSCGYKTATTKKTLNTYGPVQVYQKNFEWIAQSREFVGLFRDGMVVSDLGMVLVPQD